MRLIDADALKAQMLKYGFCASDMTVTEFVEDCLPTIEERKTGRWILDRSGAYCCSKCMEPCATYVMLKPRDKFCKMCGAKMEGTDG